MPEQRLIDAGKLFTEFEKAAWNDNADRDDVAEELLLNAPTVDAVPVVRCKYCIYRWECDMPWKVDGDWFCADGKREGGNSDAFN